MLPRIDSVPCQMSGRRSVCARDDIIRIFLSLPGNGHRIALWVNPDLPVGPKRPQNDRFHAVWGQDAEEAGPFGTRANVPGKRVPEKDMTTMTAVPMNPHLKQINSERAQEDSVLVKVGLSSRKEKKQPVHLSSTDFPHLRALIKGTTGIAPEHQKLVYSTRLMFDDEKTLADYGVGQGGVIIVHDDHSQGGELELATTHARQKLFEHDPNGQLCGKLGSVAQCLGSTTSKGAFKSRLMLRWKHEIKPDILNYNDNRNDFALHHFRPLAYESMPSTS